MNLITLIGPHRNPKTSSDNYNPDARCAYHSGSPGHDTNDCWALKYKIQNMIDAKEIEFDPHGQDLEHFCSFEFSSCIFFICSNNYYHVKLCYFINALHMFVLI